MNHDLSYAEIVRRMKLDFPITFTVADIFTGQPITISRENVLSLLIVDKDNTVLESQTCSALYGEMARFKRATELAATKAGASFRKWKAQMAQECAGKTPKKTTKAGKPAARQGPTAIEVENYYRQHADYDMMHDEPERLKAIAGLFDDLMWSFKLKGEMVQDINKLVGGYYATEARADQLSRTAGNRLDDYAALAAEASKLADDDSADVARKVAEKVSGTASKQARSLD